MKNTTTNQWKYRCKSYRKHHAKRKFRTYLGTLIVCYTLTTCFMAINAYLGLVSDITTNQPTKSLVSEARAEKEPSVVEIINKVAKDKGFEDVDLLIDIATCESSLNYRAYNINDNGTGDYGLFQFNSIHNFGEKPLDPYWSTAKAIDWIRAGKLSAWYSSKKCWQNK